jgi:plastocyanin
MRIALALILVFAVASPADGMSAGHRSGYQRHATSRKPRKSASTRPHKPVRAKVKVGANTKPKRKPNRLPLPTPGPAAPILKTPADEPSSGPAGGSSAATVAPLPVVSAAPTPPGLPWATTVTALDGIDGSFAFTLSSTTVAAGAVRFSLLNQDASAHNLAVRHPDGSTVLITEVEAGPGSSAEASVELAAGAHTLFCTIIGHEAAGMRATLRVV